MPDPRIPHEAIRALAIEAGLIEVDDLVSDDLIARSVKEAIVERVIAAARPHLEQTIRTQVAEAIEAALRRNDPVLSERVAAAVEAST